MRVSGTYRPPTMPKCPERLGRRGDPGSLPTAFLARVLKPRGRGARRPNESPNLAGVLPARRGLDARDDIYAPRPRHADGLAYGLWRETRRQDHPPPRRRLTGKRPGN